VDIVRTRIGAPAREFNPGRLGYVVIDDDMDATAQVPCREPAEREVLEPDAGVKQLRLVAGGENPGGVSRSCQVGQLAAGEPAKFFVRGPDKRDSRDLKPGGTFQQSGNGIETGEAEQFTVVDRGEKLPRDHEHSSRQVHESGMGVA
jgi:hypothetical protein